MVKRGQNVPTLGGDTEGGADPSPIDPDMLGAWDSSRRPGLQAILDELKKENTAPQWTEADLKEWLENDQEKAAKTTEDRIRHFRFMETYPAQPVMLHGTRFQFLMSARLFYDVRKRSFEEERVEKGDPSIGNGALERDLKTLKTLGKFLGVPENVWPVGPPRVQPAKETMPTPEKVYELLHHDWTPNPARNIENQWVKHVLAMAFGIGPRPPKELWFMRATAYNPDSGLLKIVEPKKRHRVRTIYVEPTWLANGTNRPSLDNWLRHRDRLNPESSAMFPNPITGRDFPSPEAFNEFLKGRVKDAFPWFHGYLARHWCCYARLIDGGLTDTNYNLVAEWFGHDSVDMTRDTYGPGARAYSKSPAYGTDWLSRAFAKPRSSNVK